MNRLEVSGLGVGYRRANGEIVPAVTDVSFTLESGVSLGIVGESGSGKSTLARALLGHCRPGGTITSGSVRINGKNVLGMPKADLQKLRGGCIAFVPQNPLSSLTPHMRVGAQVDEAVRIHTRINRRRARARTLELLAATNLQNPRGICERYPHELSGGQRQRIVIAAALAGNPDVVVLDEPTTALDKTTELQVLELVQKLRREFDTALIYVSHDLNAISYMCEKVLVMLRGHVVEEGSTSNVYRSPRHDYTVKLIAAIPRVDDRTVARSPATKDAPLLIAKELVYAYPARTSGMGLFRRQSERPAVDGVSFSVARGETLGIVGESGSGKTTVAAIVSGLTASDSGTLIFEGQSLAGLARNRSADLRRKIQMVFQDPLSSLNPRQRVETILTRPLQVFWKLKGAAARERASQLLVAMQLDPQLLESYPRQLSGGQQQRVAVARAFAAQPDLIICDEITSALDVSVQADVLKLLKELQRDSGTACLFISHDLGVIRQVADWVVVMHDGVICEAGLTDTVLDSPEDDYTKRLLAAATKELSFQDSRQDSAANFRTTSNYLTEDAISAARNSASA